MSLGRIPSEVEQWPGAEIVGVEVGGKHRRLTLSYDGRQRFVTLAVSPSDRRVEMNQLRDVRKTLAELGAKRNERRKATVKRSRNRPTRNPLANVAAAPVRENPWAALAAYVPPPSPPPSWRQRIASGIVAAWRRLLAGSGRSPTSPTAEGGDAQKEQQ